MGILAAELERDSAKWPGGGLINLTANRRYYIEAVQHEGGGGDNLAVHVQRLGEDDPANGSAPGTSGGTFGFNAPPATITITTQPAGASVIEGSRATLSVAATTTSAFGIAGYQWKRNGTAIQGATAATYTSPFLGLNDGATYTVDVSAAGSAPVTSQPAQITVVPDTIAPTVISAVSIRNADNNTTEIGIIFSEALTVASAETAANYTLSAGMVTGARHVPSSSGVSSTEDGAVLTVTGLGQGATLTVKNVADAKGNAMSATGQTISVGSTPLSWISIGRDGEAADGRPFEPAAIPVSADGFNLVSGGAAFWGNSDDITFVFEEITGDFDKKARVAYADPSSQWSRNGMTVRASLNDGAETTDLVVNSVAGGTHLFLNDGQGRFSPRVVLNEGRGGMSLTAADIDGDSDLDLYVCNYRTDTLRDQPGTNFRVDMVQGNLVVTSVNGRPTTSPDLLGRYTVNAHKRIAEHGEPDVLYLNDGKANFASVSFASGLFLDEKGAPLKVPLLDWGLSAMFRDLNGDAAPDLYVCNDFDSEDRIWLNSGAGVFRAAPPLAFRNTCKFSMGIDVADINRDGWDDVFVLDMLSLDHVTRLTRADKAMGLTPLGAVEHRPQLGRNTLHLNRGDGTYAEIAFYSGLAASEWSWTPIFLDVDLDGFEDLLVTTGHARDDMDIDTGLRIERARRARKMPVLEELNMRRSSPALATPNLAFRNQGDLTFRQAPEWGFAQSGFAHGMCLADLDNDGDADLVVNNLNAPAGVYRNESGAPRLAVRLRGAPGNTRGVGARITIAGPNTPVQSQEVLAGGRYLSSDDPLRTFATGTDTGSLRIEVRWRSGKQTVVENATPSRIYEIDEAAALASPPPSAPARKSDALALFQDVSETLGHVHHETEFDDFARQPLLPNRLSQLGPGIAWIDLNADGVDELVVGAGKGGGLAIYERSGTGTFQRWNQAPFGTVSARDQTAVLPFWDSQGVGLLAGESSYEDGLLTGAAVRQFRVNRQLIVDSVPAFASAVGPLALADFDGDGILELFVGGRVVPGRYPEAATSMVYKWQATGWAKDEANSAALREVGLVSGAVCSDLNSDGYPELVLACEWGPVRIFANSQGRLADATRAWGLDEFRGWWNGIAAGDFDGDGRIDLIASNWGLNTKYRASRDRPRRLYYGQLGAPYAVDTLEAYFDPELKKWVPERDLESLGRAMPWVRERYRQHRPFAKAGIDEILGEHLKDARVLEATWLETTVFLNRDGRFVQGTLPSSAQFSPAFGVNAADFDGDGAVDLFLSQNFFAVQPQCSRNDTGRGLLLKGDGAGAFMEMPNSGIAVYGEQRGSATGDFDRDGREDLAVTQNGAATRLFRNVRARPGLTVRLKGPPGNPHGIGGMVRLAFGSDWGPARELRGGGGYWSHDSLAPVLAMPSVPTRIQVRWPGGASTTAPLPAGAREILIDPHGTVQVIR